MIVEDRLIARIVRDVTGRDAAPGTLDVAFRKAVDTLQERGIGVTAEVARTLRDDIAAALDARPAPARPARAANRNDGVELAAAVGQ